MKDSHAWASFRELRTALGLEGGRRRVLVVEDDQEMREGLVRALADHDVDAREGVERADLPLVCDVAFLDNFFLSGNLTGVSLAPELVRTNPQARILAMSSDAGKNAEMLRGGASLAIVKSALRRLL